MTTTALARPLRSDSIFFPAMSALLAVIVIAGFAQTWFLKPFFDTPPLSPLRVVHGVAFTGWIALLIFQTSAVAANRRDLHRRYGAIGAGLAVLMVVLGVWLAIVALRQGHTNGAPSAGAFLTIPLFNILVFAVLVGIGIANRARAGFHKRYMLLATAAISDAAIARVPIDFISTGGPPVFFVLSDLFIAGCAAYDYAIARRVHPATLYSAAIIIASQVVTLAVGTTAWWTAFAHWLAG